MTQRRYGFASLSILRLLVITFLLLTMLSMAFWTDVKPNPFLCISTYSLRFTIAYSIDFHFINASFIELRPVQLSVAIRVCYYMHMAVC